MNDEREIQAATPGARRRAALLAALTALVGAVLVTWVRDLLGEAAASVKSDPLGAAARATAALRVAAAATALPLFAIVGYGYVLAFRIRASGRFPPPGTSVSRDTPVLRGPAALRRARLLALLMTVLAAAAVALPVMFDRLAETLTQSLTQRAESLEPSAGRHPVE